MFKTVFYIVVYICLFYSLYYGIMAIFAFFKTKKYKESNIKNTFAILIAARNEENVIGYLIDSLKVQNYDKDKYEIYVIVNNCTDDTLKVSKEHGAKVIECKKSKCKGDALSYAFNYLKNRKIDAYLIFDADNVVHPDFLKYMNISLNSGYKVAQGTREIKNINGNWLSASCAIYYYLQNFFFSRARKNLGLSASINGTGFMIKKEVIDTIGFDTKSLTEDIEFTGICALKGIKIDYAEKAITYDEHPTSFNVSWKQRMRWTKGSLQCLRMYTFELIKNFFKTFSLTNIDIIFLYICPMVQVGSFAALFAKLIYDICSNTLVDFIDMYFVNNALSLVVSYLSFVVVAAFVVKYNKHKIRDFLSGVLLFSLFIFTWLPINIVCLFKRKLAWAPIVHKNNISINEIIEK